jgi:hypothetical protein
LFDPVEGVFLMSSQVLAGTVVGPDSDWPVMRSCVKTLQEFGVAYEAEVFSARRAPDDYARGLCATPRELDLAGNDLLLVEGVPSSPGRIAVAGGLRRAERGAGQEK